MNMLLRVAASWVLNWLCFCFTALWRRAHRENRHEPLTLNWFSELLLPTMLSKDWPLARTLSSDEGARTTDCRNGGIYQDTGL